MFGRRVLNELCVLLFASVVLQIFPISEGLNCHDTNFRPVCATNGIKFKNLCWLKFYSYYNYLDLNRTKSAYCKAPEDACPCPDYEECQPFDNPICGYDAYETEELTFSNLCDFTCASYCNKYLYFVSCGPCVDDSAEDFTYDQCLEHDISHIQKYKSTKYKEPEEKYPKGQPDYKPPGDTEKPKVPLNYPPPPPTPYVHQVHLHTHPSPHPYHHVKQHTIPTRGGYTTKKPKTDYPPPSRTPKSYPANPQDPKSPPYYPPPTPGAPPPDYPPEQPPPPQPSSLPPYPPNDPPYSYI